MHTLIAQASTSNGGGVFPAVAVLVWLVVVVAMLAGIWAASGLVLDCCSSFRSSF